MAVKCPHCEWKLKENEETIFCQQCGIRYHKRCFDLAMQCQVCGALTPMGEKIDEKRRQEAERQCKEAEKLRIKAEKQRQEEDARRLSMEMARQKEMQEKFQARIDHLKSMGRTGYYKYSVNCFLNKNIVEKADRVKGVSEYENKTFFSIITCIYYVLYDGILPEQHK